MLIDILHHTVGSHPSIGSTLLHCNVSAVGMSEVIKLLQSISHSFINEISQAPAYTCLACKIILSANGLSWTKLRMELTPIVSLDCYRFLSSCENEA